MKAWQGMRQAERQTGVKVEVGRPSLGCTISLQFAARWGSKYEPTVRGGRQMTPKGETRLGPPASLATKRSGGFSCAALTPAEHLYCSPFSIFVRHIMENIVNA